MYMVFLAYIYVRYKICIKLHFLTYLIIKFCNFDQNFYLRFLLLGGVRWRNV